MIKFPQIKKKTQQWVDSSQLEQNNTDNKDVSDLDAWSRNVPQARTKHINSNNINFLYRQVNHYKNIRKTKLCDYRFSEAGLFLSQLNSHMLKIKSFDYNSLYRNIEYCSGYYQNQINYLLRKLKEHCQFLKEKYNEGCQEVNKKRNEHIKAIQQHSEQYAAKITIVREEIQQQQLALKPLKKIIRKLDNKRQQVLLFALGLGYDVREDGLVWILRELKRIPETNQFPVFLTDREIKFIINKYNRQQSIKKVVECKQNLPKVQNLVGTYQLINRKKQRQLSMIRQEQVLNKLKNQRNQNIRSLKQYLTEETMHLVEKLNQIKATKYQIIYNETKRKLRQICNDQIHGRKKKRRSSNVGNFTTQKLIKQFDSMIYDSINIRQKEQTIRNAQQKQLNELIKVIRMQKYSGNLWGQRNPITIVACLVGWKRGKKILEYQLNMNF